MEAFPRVRFELYCMPRSCMGPEKICHKGGQYKWHHVKASDRVGEEDSERQENSDHVVLQSLVTIVVSEQTVTYGVRYVVLYLYR